MRCFLRLVGEALLGLLIFAGVIVFLFLLSINNVL